MEGFCRDNCMCLVCTLNLTAQVKLITSVNHCVTTQCYLSTFTLVAWLRCIIKYVVNKIQFKFYRQ